MKKKFLLVWLLAAVLLLCAGCGKNEAKNKENLKIGALKGPTAIGLMDMMDRFGGEGTDSGYEFTIAVQADELLAKMVKGELDIALVPANAAATLYQKTEGNVAAIGINTLGVLYLVTGNDSIKNITDLSGKTIYLTGKGTTPEYVLKHILAENGLTDSCSLEYKSEATEVAALLAENPDAVGLLPQPFATAACMQNEKLKAVLDMNEEWDKIHDKTSRMVTGVTLVRKEVLENRPEDIKEFLEEQAKSVDCAANDTERVALLTVNAGIVAKEQIALKAIPKCNIVCITGKEMKEAFSGYLQVLYDADPASVGGKLPEEDFYAVN